MDLASAYVLHRLILSLYFKVAQVRTAAGRMEVQCIPDQRESEGLVSNVKCWDSNSMGMRGYVKEGLERAPIGSFNVEQGGCQLQT